MIYQGAIEWWFYRGLGLGVYGSLQGLELESEDLLPMPSETSNKCYDAFIDGYVLGMDLTQEEYDEIMREPEIEKKQDEPVVAEQFDFKYEKPLGNC